MGQDIDGEAASDYSGRSVSLSSDGTRVAIGAPFNDGNGSNSGHTRIWEWNGSTWTQISQDIDGEAANDQSGRSVSLSSDGTRVAIGAPFNDSGNGSVAGHTRVYQIGAPKTVFPGRVSTANLIVDTGNVGIGTSSPTSMLELAANGGSSMITLKRTNASNGGAKGGIRFTENTNGYNVGVIACLGDGANTSGALCFYTKASSTETGIYLAASEERMRISSSGNVGIGTSSPKAVSHVGKLSANSGTFNDIPQSNMGISATFPDSTRLWLGNRLSATGDDYWGMAMGVKYTGDIYIQSVNKNSTAVYDLLLQTNGGNVGVRVETPQGNLHVSDGNTTTYTGPSHTPPLYVTGNVGEEGTGSEFRHFNQTQGVGIGYASVYATGNNSNQELNIISRGTSSTYIKNYAVYSDDRLKTNEEYITNATDTLMKLKPQIYDKHNKINVISDNPIREAGLIAQDIYYDAPELRYLVSARNKGIDAGPVNIPQERPFIDDDPTNDPDYSGWGTASAGVAYIQLVPYLIKSNQELKLKNDALEARIAALENA